MGKTSQPDIARPYTLTFTSIRSECNSRRHLFFGIHYQNDSPFPLDYEGDVNMANRPWSDPRAYLYNPGRHRPWSDPRGYLYNPEKHRSWSNPRAYLYNPEKHRPWSDPRGYLYNPERRHHDGESSGCACNVM